MMRHDPAEADRDEIDAAVDELLAPLHAFVVSTAASGRSPALDARRFEADHVLKQATAELRAALKRFADTLRK